MTQERKTCRVVVDGKKRKLGSSYLDRSHQLPHISCGNRLAAGQGQGGQGGVKDGIQVPGRGILSAAIRT